MLPQELVDAIVDWASDDREVLKRLGLTHRSFGPRTRKHLFRSVSIKYNSSTHTFLNLISPLPMGPTIASSVQHLTIVGMKNKSEIANRDLALQVIIRALVNLQDLVFLRTYSNTLQIVTDAFPFYDTATCSTRSYIPIQRIAFHDCVLRSSAHLLNLLAKCPLVTTLDMDTINVIDGGAPNSVFCEMPPLEIQNLFVGTFNPSDLEDVEKVLRHTTMISLASLQTLVLHGSSLSSTFLELKQIAGLRQIFSHSQTVVLRKSTLNDESVELPLRNSARQTITVLHIRLHSFATSVTLQWWNTHLMTQNPTSTVYSIEELEIEAPGNNPGDFSSLWQNIGGVLGDIQRCPRLRRVTIVVIDYDISVEPFGISQAAPRGLLDDVIRNAFMALHATGRLEIRGRAIRERGDYQTHLHTPFVVGHDDELISRQRLSLDNIFQ